MELSMVHFVTVTLMTIAFGMGLGLEVADFSRLATAPKPVLVGLCGQIVLLPLVAMGLASMVPVTTVAVGLLLMGVCPGGSSSNYFSYIARGDVALSVTLTAVTGMFSALYVPVLFNFAAGVVLDTEINVYLPVARTMKEHLSVPGRSRALRHGAPQMAASLGGQMDGRRGNDRHDCTDCSDPGHDP